MGAMLGTINESLAPMTNIALSPRPLEPGFLCEFNLCGRPATAEWTAQDPEDRETYYTMRCELHGPAGNVTSLPFYEHLEVCATDGETILDQAHAYEAPSGQWYHSSDCAYEHEVME